MKNLKSTCLSPRKWDVGCTVLVALTPAGRRSSSHQMLLACQLCEHACRPTPTISRTQNIVPSRHFRLLLDLPPPSTTSNRAPTCFATTSVVALWPLPKLGRCPLLKQPLLWEHCHPCQHPTCFVKPLFLRQSFFWTRSARSSRQSHFLTTSTSAGLSRFERTQPTAFVFARNHLQPVA